MARKQKGLPFVVQPRLEPVTEVIGTEESGQIEIIRRGYLTVAEKAFIQGTTADDHSIQTLHALARTIAREQSEDIGVVVEQLMGSMDRKEYMAEYEEQILMALTELGRSNERQSMLIATCMLLFRVDTDWTLEQTAELHPDLIEALVLLYKDEDARSLKALEAAAAEKSVAAAQAKENSGKN